MFEVPNLEYEYDALGEHISKDIMILHHDKHHRAYVDKLNAAIDGREEFSGRSIEDILSNISAVPEEIRQTIIDNGGGHYNHSLFWRWMSPNGGGQPGGELLEAIVAKYGSFEAFVDKFTTEALGVFGSGWVWLQPNMDILTTANQDSPLIEGKDEPILGLDVWEHAYYLDYKNARADYVKAWWNVVNWDTAEERYDRFK